MNKKTAIILIAALGALELALGFAGGAEYVMRKVDIRDAIRAGEQNQFEANRATFDEQRDSMLQTYLGDAQQCRAQFSTGTVLYETPAAQQLSNGIRQAFGLGVTAAPGENIAPRWWIPARIKPQLYGPANGAVYYYIGSDARADGPYLPETIAGQSR